MVLGVKNVVSLSFASSCSDSLSWEIGFVSQKKVVRFLRVYLEKARVLCQIQMLSFLSFFHVFNYLNH